VPVKRRRVVITGIGGVTPIGSGREGLWSGVRMGQSAVRRVTRFDATQFRSQTAAEVDDFDPMDFMEGRTAKRLDRFAQFGVAAAIQASEDADLGDGDLDPTRCGVSVGSALGGLAYGEDQHSVFLEDGIKAIPPMLALAVYGGASAAHISIELDLRGPNLANANSCASGAMAVGEAWHVIARDEADVMFAGGVEAPLSPLLYGAFCVIRAMSTRNDEPETASRPFDAHRDGFVMGEGSALLVLEERNHALRRNVPIYAELLGYGQSNDAYHMTVPRPEGSESARAIRLAMQSASIDACDIEYVNAHATGTPLGDRAESRAIRCALGPGGEYVPVSGTKGLYGHALGASGAIEVAITALALHCGYLPGTLNLNRIDSECSLAVLPPGGRTASVGCALTTSFGFGGANAALVLAQPDFLAPD
jgi:3-oxoacyl-[acyl-carrier-protein] synthase II